MKVTEYHGSDARRVLIATITSTDTLNRIHRLWGGDGFPDRTSNVIAKLCFEYASSYGRAPGADIEPLFRSWASEHQLDPDSLKLGEELLSSLSGEYDRIASEQNPDYLADLAHDVFLQTRLDRLLEEAQALRARGRLQEAVQKVSGFNPSIQGISPGTHLFTDEAEIRELFASRDSELLLRLPEDDGKFFQDTLARDTFLSFAAPEKRGKSYLLQHLAYRALLLHKRVAYFCVGDLSRRQIERRFMARVSRRPWGPRTIHYPLSISPGSVKFDEIRFDDFLDFHEAWPKCQELMTRKVKSRKSHFYLEVHPAMSITVDGIRTSLDRLEREEDFLADIVIIDYADILAPKNPRSDKRDQIDDTWSRLRGLSMARHCLIVTATQTNRASYNVANITMEHLSEDKRKLAHVNGMIAINTSPLEKQFGIVRLGWIVCREEEANPFKQLHCATCLSIADPAVVTYYDDRGVEYKLADNPPEGDPGNTPQGQRNAGIGPRRRSRPFSKG